MIHWLSVTVRNMSLDEFEIMVYDTFPELLGAVQEVSSSRWFQVVYATPGNEIRFYNNLRTDDSISSVVITGGGCDLMDHTRLMKLLSYLQIYDYKVTRMDVALDGLGMSVQEFRENVLSGEMATRHNTIKYMETIKKGGKESTFYIGSRQSERMMRVYDRRGVVRMELEAHDGYAHALFLSYIMNLENAVVSAMKDFLHNYVEKVKEFFDSIVNEYVEIVKLVKPSTKNIKKKVEWLLKQVSYTLALVEEYDKALLESIISSGKRKITETDRLYYCI